MQRTAAVAIVVGTVLSVALARFIVSHRRRQAKLGSTRNVSSEIVLRARGAEVATSRFGASLVAVRIADAHGAVADVVLGHPQSNDYLDDAHNAYFGCTVGRVANRIAEATFTLPRGERGARTAKVYQLEANDQGRHALHGGSRHWGRQRWDAAEFEHEAGPAVRFTRRSPAGEASYPGAVSATVTYILKGARTGSGPQLWVEMSAVTTEATPLNLVHHTYWNLAGHDAIKKGATVHTHRLQVSGAHITPSGPDLIPSGAVEPVRGTPFDFLTATPVADALSQLPNGLDHNYVLHSDAVQPPPSASPGGMARAVPQEVANLFDPMSGRGFRLATNAPGLQVYSGNFLEGVPGKDGVTYKRHQGICLESQTFPNGVNQETFPDPTLHPGQEYRHVMVFSFYTHPALRMQRE